MVSKRIWLKHFLIYKRFDQVCHSHQDVVQHGITSTFQKWLHEIDPEIEKLLDEHIAKETPQDVWTFALNMNEYFQLFHFLFLFFFSTVFSSLSYVWYLKWRVCLEVAPTIWWQKSSAGNWPLSVCRTCTRTSPRLFRSYSFCTETRQSWSRTTTSLSLVSTQHVEIV